MFVVVLVIATSIAFVVILSSFLVCLGLLLVMVCNTMVRVLGFHVVRFIGIRDSRSRTRHTDGLSLAYTFGPLSRVQNFSASYSCSVLDFRHWAFCIIKMKNASHFA